jgi:hypothetical protein
MAEVGIPEVLLPDFRDHVRRWAEPGSHGRVFVGPKGATPRRSNFNRLWKLAAVTAGVAPEVGLHFHDLRDTRNHLTKGASLKDVMRRLGHASTRAALIYQHADRDSERAIAASLSETITAALAGSNGHAAGTAAAGGDSGRDPQHVGPPMTCTAACGTPNGIRTRVATLRGRRRFLTESGGPHDALLTRLRVRTESC